MNILLHDHPKRQAAHKGSYIAATMKRLRQRKKLNVLLQVQTRDGVSHFAKHQWGGFV